MPINRVIPSPSFENDIKHIKDSAMLEKIKKQIDKITKNPEVGKPLGNVLKGERTVYVKPYRIIYSFQGDTLFLLRFDHRDHVYGRRF